jgi:hypothetical protein
MESKDEITMEDAKAIVEDTMNKFNNGELSQEKAAVILKMAELIRTSFKVEREYNAAVDKSKE